MQDRERVGRSRRIKYGNSVAGDFTVTASKN